MSLQVSSLYAWIFPAALTASTVSKIRKMLFSGPRMRRKYLGLPKFNALIKPNPLGSKATAFLHVQHLSTVPYGLKPTLREYDIQKKKSENLKPNQSSFDFISLSRIHPIFKQRGQHLACWEDLFTSQIIYLDDAKTSKHISTSVIKPCRMG